MTEINFFEKTRDSVLMRMEKELPPNLYYHGIHHTRDDVLPFAETIGAMVKLGKEDFLLLRTAAVYHDIGYTQDYDNHEEAGVEIVSRELPNSGYSPEQIRKIVNMIRATRMPQSPKTYLEQLLCDADLNSLGSIDFFIKSQSLRLELCIRGEEIPVLEWYKRQLDFLLEHEYFTEVVRKLREPRKQKHIQELTTLLNR